MLAIMPSEYRKVYKDKLEKGIKSNQNSNNDWADTYTLHTIIEL